MSNCFCHLSINDTSYEVKDAKARPFNTIGEIKAKTNLLAGNIVRSIGYHVPNDGGGATYIIREKTPSDIEDNGSIHFLVNGLVAEMIIENNTVLPEQYGCYGDGTHDDTNCLQRCIDSNYNVVSTGIYKVNNEIHIKNSFVMSGESFIKADSTYTGTVVSVSKDIQRTRQKYHINVDSNSVASLGIGLGKIRMSEVSLNVKNAGTTGIIMNDFEGTGNGGNEFTCNVIGNSEGTTNVGVLVNCYDSMFKSIITQDCKIGVQIDDSELVALYIHPWISNELAPILYKESIGIDNVSYHPLKIDWFYQDSVKIGINGNSYGHIDYFEYSNTLTDSSYSAYKNVVGSAGLRLTIDRFRNDKNENCYLTYDITDMKNCEFGVLSKNGVTSVQSSVQNYIPFTDANNAPQWGTFYVKYDTLNLPVEQGGSLKSEVVGPHVIQTYLSNNYISNGVVYKRMRKIGEETWGTWNKYFPTTT